MNLALRKSSVFTCNLISQSYNILFLALVFSNQTKRKFRVKAWTAVSKELLGVFFVNYKDISMPKNVWNPWVLSVLSACESRYSCCTGRNKFDGRTVATSNRKNSKAQNWIQIPKNRWISRSVLLRRGIPHGICIQSSSFHWLPDVTSFPSLSSPPPSLDKSWSNRAKISAAPLFWRVK